MGKYSGILLCSDFDGTLYYHRQISPENANAIRAFQAEGGLFTMASGRFPRTFRAFEDSFNPNAPVITLGGSAIYDRTSDSLLYAGLMARDSLDFARFVWENYPYVTSLNVYHADDSVELTREHDASFDAFIPRLPEEIFKMVFHTDRTMSETLRDEMQQKYSDRYFFSRAGRSGLEMQGPNDSKGQAVRRLRAMLGSRVEQVVCVGDFENDISMFEVADRSFAVAGGSPLAAAAADCMTVTCAEHAVAAVIAAL